MAGVEGSGGGKMETTVLEQLDQTLEFHWTLDGGGSRWSNSDQLIMSLVSGHTRSDLI